MRFFDLHKVQIAPLLLLGTGAILIGIALFGAREGITAAAVVIAGTICFFAGIFLLTFAGEETFDTRMISLLPVQGIINVCRLTADLGIHGNAWFLPEKYHQGSGVVQVIPVAQYNGEPVTGDSFLATGSGGVIVPPTCNPLLLDLEERCTLTAPAEPAAVDALFKELTTEVVGCADAVTIVRRENLVTVTLTGYRFIHGCREIARESPRCCITCPCPVCSLFGVLLAKSRDSPVEVRRCEPSEKEDQVTAIFAYL